jgi:hypothetical protein
LAGVFGHGEFLLMISPKIAQTLALLTNLLIGKDLPKLLPWKEGHDAAFAAAKATSVATLHHFDAALGRKINTAAAPASVLWLIRYNSKLNTGVV